MIATMPVMASRMMPVVWALSAVSVVIAAAGATFWLTRGPAEPAITQATRPAGVTAGRDYYVFVRLIEFKPHPPGGGNWDSGNNSAPDAAVTLYWRGNRVFELPTRKDQFIATWDLFSVDVRDILLSGASIDVASIMNAPLVKIAADDPIVIEVYDDDPMGDDLALSLKIDLSTLSEGRNAIALPEGTGLNRLEIDLIDRQTPLSRLVELAAG